MQEFGCDVDLENGLLKIPPHLVEEAINTAPKKFKLGGMDPDKKLNLGEGRSYFSTDGQGTLVVDPETGERRESTMKDLAYSAAICDSLDYIDLFWPLVCASDVSPETRTLRELVVCYRYTGKHIQTDVFASREVPHFIKALEIIQGNTKRIKADKIFSVVCCSVSPLQYDAEMMEACADLTEFEVPINVLPMPIAGATSPVSLLSTVLMNNIEVLGALVVFQAFKQGTPVIYGSSSSILDMKTGTFAVGAPEEGLLNAGCTEMAHYYGLPSLTSGLASDAKEPGIQAALDKLISGITPWLAGTDILTGAGLMETCQCLYFEQLIIDQEIFALIKRAGEGIRGGEKFIFSDLIKEIGAGGHFLSQKSTKELLRQGEHFIPDLISREPYEMWLKSHRKDPRKYAQNKVKKMLEAPRKEYLEPRVITELDKLMEAAEEELAKT